MKRPITTSSLAVLGDYGRSELKRSFHSNYLLGLSISVCIHFSIVGSYYLWNVLGAEEEIPMVRVKVLKYSDLGPPPSITASSLPPPLSVAAAVKPSIGVPIPVPDAEVSPEQTIMSQTELSAQPSPAGEDLGDQGGVQVSPDLTIEDEPGMDEFVPVERAPQIVKRVMPVYPELAVRAGLEGTVWVKILVDKEGKPKKVAIAKSTTEIFNQSAIDAAMQFIFTPAVMNNGPVKVWVSIPFRFQIKEVKGPT